MTFSYCIAIPDFSKDVREKIKSGPIAFSSVPGLEVRSLKLKDVEPLLSRKDADVFEKYLCLTHDYIDPAKRETSEDIVENTAIALQLVKPTRQFLKYFLHKDSGDKPTSMSAELHQVELKQVPNPYLAYQQHNIITLADIDRADKLLPSVMKAMRKGQSSWDHECGPVHRATALFCQGYDVLPDIRQFIWAAGLDVLFASKIDRRKRGSRTICERLHMFFGGTFKPYSGDTVKVPVHQQRPDHKLIDISWDIFKFRNAYIHGLTIPESWLIKPGNPPETGYAYQLLECTEITLRLSLLRILEDPSILRVFVDPAKLDKYF